MECGKCGGTGKVDKFRGIANGICFQCGGSGKIAVKETKGPKFKVGDVIKKKYPGAYQHKILKITPKYYLTSERSKLGRFIDKYPPGHKEEWILVSD